MNARLPFPRSDGIIGWRHGPALNLTQTPCHLCKPVYANPLVGEGFPDEASPEHRVTGAGALTETSTREARL